MKTKVECPEFPYFGARYPDATCIDGYLWDLDKFEDGQLYSTGDNPPCPFCNEIEYLEDHKHDDDDFRMEEFKEWKEKTLKRYLPSKV